MNSFRNINIIPGLVFLTCIGSFQVTAIASVKNQPQMVVKQEVKGKNSQPHPVFKPILSKLKQKTQIKILLPQYIGELDGENPLYAIIETATKNKYEILLGFSPDCSGGTACRLGIITGETITPKMPRLTGKPVLLAQGITGYFVDFRCGANCSDATLTWKYQGVQYTIGLKAGDRNSLIKMAKSVITP
ncbi:MAG: hypothetical protein NWQ43_16050 [Dolichospermum sp.]|uniref:hypothetical protein n=1 Tax=Anabaena sp. UHCC 0187 TaxID=2590018 RepID=UPI001580A30C|nr:hypothetical protein [Anabaena sp. UHCC 0187]MDP5018787.1 hypothetical protein [Dolichospermum sp.]